MSKSQAKVNMERALLESIYQMASESMTPESFEKLESVIAELCITRNLGEFEFFPRKKED